MDFLASLGGVNPRRIAEQWACRDAGPAGAPTRRRSVCSMLGIAVPPSRSRSASLSLRRRAPRTARAGRHPRLRAHSAPQDDPEAGQATAYGQSSCMACTGCPNKFPFSTKPAEPTYPARASASATSRLPLRPSGVLLFGLAAATGSSPAKTPTAQASSAPIADPTVTQRPLESPPPTLAMQAAPSPALSSAAPLTATTAARASTPTSAPSAVVATRANTRPQVQATDAAKTPCEDFAIFYSDLVTYTPHDLLRLIPDVQQVQKDALTGFGPLRVSRSSQGRRTTTVRVPGTGLFWRSTRRR